MIEHRSLRHYAATLISVTLIVSMGCDQPSVSADEVSAESSKRRFELHDRGDGSFIRLNIETGELAILAERQLVPVEDLVAMEEKRQTFSEAINWKPSSVNPLSMEGALEAGLKTSWRGGRLLFEFTIRPISDDLLRAQDVEGNYFQLELRDAGGMNVKEHRIPFADMFILTSSDGKAAGFSIDSSFECSIEDYEALKQWGFKWKLAPPNDTRRARERAD